MKKILSIISLAALSIVVLGSCSKINERIDGIDQRVGSIEQEKIASIENQIAAIKSSIADLDAIKKHILALQTSVSANGDDISGLKAADEAIGKRIDELKAYVGDLSKFAEKDWAMATFATLEQLNATKTYLSALKESIDKLSGTFDGKIAELNTNLTNSINNAISGVNASISTLEARVSALEKMIQTVTIVPAYSDGSVKEEDGILELNLIVSPAEAAKGLTKGNVKILANVVLTKAVSVATVQPENITSFTVDENKGTVEMKADISDNLPSEASQALTVAVNIKNGISNFTTEFVPVTVILPPPTPVEAELTMFYTPAFEEGQIDSDWNKIAITIKGTDIVSGSYYFDETTVVNASGEPEELVKSKGVKLSADQIGSVNSAEGLLIIKENLKEETEYKTVFVLSNSAGSSNTFVATFSVGQVPPPM